MTTTKDVVKGGAFLIDDSEPSDVFTPERFDDEQLMAAPVRTSWSARLAHAWRRSRPGITRPPSSC